MSSAAGRTAAGPGGLNPTPHIGAFVLETLTVGMYGEPRHTLREYVQNSFDSIRAAQRTKRITGPGRVDVRLEPDAITVRDNGLGVSADTAWATLTSVGASKKDRQRDAGFRGIGRMAGMAYCEELTFRTTFPGETVLTTVTFDCAALLKAMDPDEGGDVELATLLAKSIQFAQDPSGAATAEHFFEVVMSGLGRAPASLTDADDVSTYLSETVPVAFADDWQWKDAVEADYFAYFGVPLEVIEVFVQAGDTPRQIRKPYGEAYSLGSGVARLRHVEFVTGGDNTYWGWVGHLDESGAVTDPPTRGLRIRVRNIQVDGTSIFETLFAEVKPSYARFSAYYIGEVHIAPDRIVPNARRDGFEETESWGAIKASLRTDICERLASQAYESSKTRQLDVDKLVSEIDDAVARSSRLAESSRATYDQIVDLMNSAKRLRRKAASALKIVGDLDDAAADAGSAPAGTQADRLRTATRDVESVEAQARQLVGRFVTEDARVSGLKERLREEVVREVLDVISLYVDQSTYQRIRRHLTGPAAAV